MKSAKNSYFGLFLSVSITGLAACTDAEYKSFRNLAVPSEKNTEDASPSQETANVKNDGMNIPMPQSGNKEQTDSSIDANSQTGSAGDNSKTGGNATGSAADSNPSCASTMLSNESGGKANPTIEKLKNGDAVSSAEMEKLMTDYSDELKKGEISAQDLIKCVDEFTRSLMKEIKPKDPSDPASINTAVSNSVAVRNAAVNEYTKILAENAGSKSIAPTTPSETTDPSASLPAPPKLPPLPKWPTIPGLPKIPGFNDQADNSDSTPGSADTKPDDSATTDSPTTDNDQWPPFPSAGAPGRDRFVTKR
ncbi:MAG: hypothetical protein HQK54_12775 [Oligoflexales bacterium]|nr:hypothetical protein [Oligoflexales bacterium]